MNPAPQLSAPLPGARPQPAQGPPAPRGPVRGPAPPGASAPHRQPAEARAREYQEVIWAQARKEAGTYFPFVRGIRNRRDFGTPEAPLKLFVETPYMTVEGRLKQMIDDHRRERAKYTLTTELVSVQLGEVVCHLAKATFESSFIGTTVGLAKVGLGASDGVDATNPIENAQTSAIGRALAQAGYGLLGTGYIASYEEVQAVLRERGTAPAGPRGVPRGSLVSPPPVPSGGRPAAAGLAPGAAAPGPRDVQAPASACSATLASPGQAVPPLGNHSGTGRDGPTSPVRKGFGQGRADHPPTPATLMR